MLQSPMALDTARIPSTLSPTTVDFSLLSCASSPGLYGLWSLDSYYTILSFFLNPHARESPKFIQYKLSPITKIAFSVDPESLKISEFACT